MRKGRGSVSSFFYYTSLRHANIIENDMHGNKLRSRLKFIPASPIPNRATGSIFSRRKSNSSISVESHPNEEFDNFFDFENDFSESKPSRELYFESSEAESGVIMEEGSDHSNYDNKNNFFIMEYSNDSDFSTNEFDKEETNEILTDSQCLFFSTENVRCDEKKVGSSIFCSEHQISGMNNE